MAKKEKKDFVASLAKANFKLDKQTKVMMALSGFKNNVKLSANEQADAKVSLSPLTRGDYKDLMIRGQLSEVDAKLTGMDDPLWKPKKEKDESEGKAEAGTSASQPGRKGKKHIKMRKDHIVAVQASAN